MINEILQYVLFTIGAFSLTVGDLLSVLLIFFGTKVLLWLISKAYEKRFASMKDDRGRKYALTKITGYVVWTLAIILMLHVLAD